MSNTPPPKIEPLYVNCQSKSVATALVLLKGMKTKDVFTEVSSFAINSPEV
jgi:hypothetical protein